MKFSHLCMSIVVILMFAVTAFAEVPEYTAYKTGSAMVMDGILDESAWQKAQSVGDFRFQWYESGEKEQTEAKIVWDNERIFLALVTEHNMDPDDFPPWVASPTRAQNLK